MKMTRTTSVRSRTSACNMQCMRSQSTSKRVGSTHQNKKKMANLSRALLSTRQHQRARKSVSLHDKIQQRLSKDANEEAHT